MKQNITIEQLNELSDEQKERLIDWYQSVGDYTRNPLLSIGQMIERVSIFGQENHLENLYICNERYSQIGGVVWKWFVRREYAEYESTELCDALWEAVKKTLGECQ